MAVANDRNLWVRGIGDINITRSNHGKQKQGVLKKVLFISELRRNLFSIELASKAGLSFQTLENKCALYRDLGKGPKVMEGTQVATFYNMSIFHVTLPTTEHDNGIHHPPPAALAVTSACENDLVLWHNMMGHVNVQALQEYM